MVSRTGTGSFDEKTKVNSKNLFWDNIGSVIE